MAINFSKTPELAWKAAKSEKYLMKAGQKLITSMLSAKGITTVLPNKLSLKDDPTNLTTIVYYDSVEIGKFSKHQIESYAAALEKEAESFKAEQAPPQDIKQYTNISTWPKDYISKAPPPKLSWAPPSYQQNKLVRHKEVKSIRDVYELPYNCGKNPEPKAEVSGWTINYSGADSPDWYIANKATIDAYAALLDADKAYEAKIAEAKDKAKEKAMQDHYAKLEVQMAYAKLKQLVDSLKEEGKGSK